VFLITSYDENVAIDEEDVTIDGGNNGGKETHTGKLERNIPNS